MNEKSIQQLRKRRVSAAIVLTLAGLFVAPLAFARVALNTIDPVAVVADHGRHIVVTGPLTCTRGEKAFLEVTVTQRPTGAVAEGSTRITCTGNSQQWQVHASTRGRETFAEGLATAVAIARTADHGDITDAHQWLVTITLDRE